MGEIGDEYFIAACIALAERMDRLKAIFAPMEELNSQGFVSVNVFSKGKPVSYIMDDLLMVKPYWNQYVDFPFAPLLNDGAAWLIFAEKAFARQNGWYYRIEGGRFGEAIRFLTGAPTREYQTQEFSAELLFKNLIQAVYENHIVTATSSRGNNDQNDEFGLMAAYHYTVIGAFEIMRSGKPLLLVKLRDPWAKSHYTGPWNAQDERWSQKLKEKLSYSD